MHSAALTGSPCWIVGTGPGLVPGPGVRGRGVLASVRALGEFLPDVVSTRSGVSLVLCPAQSHLVGARSRRGCVVGLVRMSFAQYVCLLRALSDKLSEYEGVLEACESLRLGFLGVGLSELAAQVEGLRCFVKYVDPRRVSGLGEFLCCEEEEFVLRWRDLPERSQFAGAVFAGTVLCNVLYAFVVQVLLVVLSRCIGCAGWFSHCRHFHIVSVCRVFHRRSQAAGLGCA